MRIPTILGAITGSISAFAALIYLIAWCIKGFNVHNGPTILLICFLAGVQMFFTGMMGEYILGINERMKNRPLVVEERRLNFDIDNAMTTNHAEV